MYNQLISRQYEIRSDVLGPGALIVLPIYHTVYAIVDWVVCIPRLSRSIDFMSAPRFYRLDVSVDFGDLDVLRQKVHRGMYSKFGAQPITDYKGACVACFGNPWDHRSGRRKYALSIPVSSKGQGDLINSPVTLSSEIIQILALFCSFH